MKLIKLACGLRAKVDSEDYANLAGLRWHSCNGYATRYLPRNGKPQRKVWMHRLIMKAPKHLFVDHINGDKLDNRKVNLRICTKQQNCLNRVNISKANKSGYHGVYWVKAKRLWRAEITVNGKKKYVKSGKCKEAVARAYDEAARKQHGQFAVTNFKGLR